MSRFISGFAAPFSGFAYLLARPALWPFLALPILLNLLITAFCAWASARWILAPVFREARRAGSFWDAARGILLGAALASGILAALILFFIALAILLSSPFNDLMTERIERAELARRPGLLAPALDWRRSLKHSILEALRRGMIAIPLALAAAALGWIPWIGPPLAVLISAPAAGLFLTLDAFSYSLDRRDYSLRRKFIWLRENTAASIGFAAALLILFAIPCAWFFIPPAAAAAATRAYCRCVLAKISQT